MFWKISCNLVDSDPETHIFGIEQAPHADLAMKKFLEKYFDPETKVYNMKRQQCDSHGVVFKEQ